MATVPISPAETAITSAPPRPGGLGRPIGELGPSPRDELPGDALLCTALLLLGHRYLPDPPRGVALVSDGRIRLSLPPNTGASAPPEPDHGPVFALVGAADEPARDAAFAALDAAGHACPLALAVLRPADGSAARLTLHRDPGWLEAVGTDQLIAHLRRAIALCGADPAPPLATTSLLTLAEHQKIIRDWNATESPVERDRFGFERVDAVARAHPGAIAIRDGEREVTYRRFVDTCNALARWLQAHGGGRGSLTAVLAPRGGELVTMLTGIQKSGGAFLLLDPEQPPERLRFVLRDAGCQRILATRASLPRLPSGDLPPATVWEELESSLSIVEADPPPHGLVDGDPAYVFYTSGTSGAPKGVRMRHNSRLPSPEGDAFAEVGRVSLVKAALSFTLILHDVHTPLQAGGTLLIVPPGREGDIAWLRQAIRTHRIARLSFVPTMLATLLRADRLDGCDCIEKVYTVGESLTVPLQREFFRRLPRARLFVYYGCTEAPATIFREVRPDEPYGDRIILGRPAANKRVYLLDRHLVPVPIGVPGEIYAAGRLSLGYVGQAGPNAARFIPDPFAARPGELMYRTGDLGRFLPDGNVEYLGRRDLQVKIHGVRIELAEVRAALLRCPGVADAEVTVHGEDQAAYLCGYLLGSADLNVADLRRQLGEWLSDPMIPTRFVRVSGWPVTPNGKLDRRALPLPDAANQIPAGRAPPASPETIMEIKLAELWRRLFRRDAIGRHDNFYDLGGDSILAIQLAAEIERWVGRSVSYPTLLQAQTVAEQARMIVDQHWAPAWQSLVPLQPLGERRPIFCTHPLGGNAFVFLPLARALAPDRPVHGLQILGLESRQPVHDTIEAMAAQYAREIRLFQPQGPWFLTGYSASGWMAYAVAQELKRESTEQVVLFLGDTRGMRAAPWSVRLRIDLPFRVSRIYRGIGQLCRGNVRDGTAPLPRRFGRFLQAFREEKLAAPPPPSAAAAQDATENLAPMFGRYVRKIMFRPPARQAVDVEVFTGRDAQDFRHAAFWGRLTSGRVRVHLVPGEHGTMLDADHAPGFATVFRQVLDDVEAGGDGRRPGAA